MIKGKLRLEGEFECLLKEDEREAWLKELEATDWNVFVEGPPHGRSKPEHVLKYLARYISGGPIADSRLIGWTEPEGRVSGDVWFWARSGDKENKSKPFRLSGVEFVRRWSMHILPKGYTRSRSYGGFHGPQRRDYLERCRQVLGITEPAAEQASEPLELVEWKLPTCERCKLEMELISSSERPSWSDVFKYGVYCEPFVYVPILHFTFGAAGGSFDRRIWIVFPCVPTCKLFHKSLPPQPIAIEVRLLTAKRPKSLPIRARHGLSLLFQANKTCCKAVMIGRLSGTYRRFQRLESA